MNGEAIDVSIASPFREGRALPQRARLMRRGGYDDFIDKNTWGEAQCQDCRIQIRLSYQRTEARSKFSYLSKNPLLHTIPISQSKNFVKHKTTWFKLQKTTWFQLQN